MMKFLSSSVLILILLSGCSPFGGNNSVSKLVADGLTPKELYNLAENKVKAGSLDQAIEQYEILLSSYPSSKYAIQARLDIAYNLFKRKKYKRAIIQLDDYISKYPSLPSTPYAYYLRGIIAEEKSLSILDNIITDSAQRDVKSVRNAYAYYIELIDKFPNSEYSEDALKKLNSLKNTLARHEFYVAIYYAKTGSYIASINRTQFVIKNFPNSSSIPSSLHLMAYSYDQLNALKLAADARKVLASSYPNYSKNYSID